jgi:hypothetical protein
MFKEQCGSHMVEIIMLGFFGVNNNKDVNVKCSKTMRCIFYYSSLTLFYNLKTQARKGLIIFKTTNGITTLKKM